MDNKITASDLYYRVDFDIMTEVPDEHGGYEQVPTTFTARAHFRYLRGGEAVQAARLQGKQPVVVTVRRSSQTLKITTDARMRDARTGDIYNIRAIVPTDDRQFLEITAEKGVAV